MKKYRKKPVVIEAVKHDGSAASAYKLRAWIGAGCDDYWKDHQTIIRIKTLEGTMEALPGDYIIKGIKGEFYPCKPDIFYDTYEAVDE